MSSAYKPVIGLLAVVLVFAAIGTLSKLFERKDIIPWRADLAAAQQQAREKNQPLLLYFSATWCEPCQNMKHTTWADSGVAKALSNIVTVKLDYDQNPQLDREYRVDALPAFRLLSADGKPLKEHAGAMEPEEFLQWLRP